MYVTPKMILHLLGQQSGLIVPNKNHHAHATASAASAAAGNQRHWSPWAARRRLCPNGEDFIGTGLSERREVPLVTGQSARDSLVESAQPTMTHILRLALSRAHRSCQSTLRLRLGWRRPGSADSAYFASVPGYNSATLRRASTAPPRTVRHPITRGTAAAYIRGVASRPLAPSGRGRGSYRVQPTTVRKPIRCDPLQRIGKDRRGDSAG